MDRRIIAGAAVLLVCAFGVLIATRSMTVAPDDSRPSSVGPSAPSDPSPSVVSRVTELGFLGVIIARESVDLAAKFDSRVERVDVRPGDRVKAGARLATLDVRTVRQDLLMAEAAVQTTEAEREQATLELTEASARLERLTRLPDLVSGEQIATGRFQEKLAAARLERARAQIAERRARVDQLRETIRDADIRAPFDGVVAARYLDPGTTVARGTPIVRLISPGALWVRFAVPEDRASGISVGRHVTARLENPGLALPGVIESITPEVDSALQMIVVEARLGADAAAKEQIPPGAVARVSLGDALQPPER